MKQLTIHLCEVTGWLFWPVILVRSSLSYLFNRIIWYVSLLLTRFGPIMALYKKIAGQDGILWGPVSASWIWTVRMYILVTTIVFSTQLTDDVNYFGALVLILAVFVALTSAWYKVLFNQSQKEILQFIKDLENARR